MSSAFFVGVAAAVAVAAVEGKTNKPNILFILADDLGYGDVSVYPNPSPTRLSTPRLAKLASEGMVFTQAYAGYSVCAPSRRTLMTGYHVGHFDNNFGGPLLSNRSVTVAHILRGGGYRTKLIGKWGLDGNYPKPRAPQEGFPTLQGFDEFYGQSDQFQCHDYYPPFMFNGTRNETVATNVGSTVQSCGDDFDKCTWSADLWTADAVSWIQSTTAANVPWFLYLAYTSPHAGSVGSIAEDDVPGPRLSKSEYAKDTQWPLVERHFANTVTLVDTAVGEVVDAVDAAGAKEATVIFFSSDNGAHQEGGHRYQFFNSSGYLNGFKRSIHDGGHRAAFIVRWPGTVAAGVTSTHMLCFYDFLPTAAAIAGLDAAVPPTVDGHSFLPTLLGNEQPQPAFIYHEYTDCSDPSLAPYPAVSRSFGQNVRVGNWSGVCAGADRPCTGQSGNSRFFLYDMSVDEAQLHDVSEQHPSVVKMILDVMRNQFNYSWDPAGTGGSPTPTPPLPGPHPAPSPCTTDLTGTWWGSHNNTYTMTVSSEGDVVLHAPPGCCAWSNATGTFSGITIHVVAHGKNNFQLDNVGTVSEDRCAIDWSKRWAPWRKQLSSL